MISVFIAGSRKLSRLNEQIRDRLGNVIAGSYQVIIGDANGVDKAVQSFLLERSYQNVVVYCSGTKCRNNLGAWPTCNVPVPSDVKGRDFYTQKDIEMAANADYGLMIWDGKSAGTLNNVMELLNRRKKALVYLSSKKKFFTVSSLNDAESLLAYCSPSDVKELGKKIGLKSRLNEMAHSSQHALDF